MKLENRENAPASQETLLNCILDIGQMLLTSGAEVLRVEDTVTRLCIAYGFEKADVFTIPSSIVLTVRTRDSVSITQTRRIHHQQIDLDKISKINALSRKLCAEPLPIPQLQEAIQAAQENHRYPFWLQMLLHAGISGAFCLFFGGNGLDAVAAFLSGTMMCLIIRGIGRLHMNDILDCMLVSFLVGTAIVPLTFLGLAQNPDKVIIGNIMLLIPGLQFTSAIRDMISGDTLSGLLGLCQAILKAAAVATGFAAAMLLLGGFL